MPSREIVLAVTLVLAAIIPETSLQDTPKENKASCPEPCFYGPSRYDRNLLDCSAKALTSIPSQLPATTEILVLSDNQLEHLPAGVFNSLTLVRRNVSIDP
ncbi:leucine-rich repeat and transmembrane domain-containing protein 1-like [Oculina patagonica]